jgi:predicted RNA-binding Zn-ribbon protein involved in translation (DUF1610 family)
MDLATISAGVAGIRTAYQALRSALETKSQIGADQRVADALTQLGSSLDATYELRDELFRLQEENRTLRQAQHERDEWSTRAAAYTLTAAPGGAMVQKTPGPPEHYACPRCFENRKIYPLQDRSVMSGDYTCPGCGRSFAVDQPTKLPPLVYPEDRGGSSQGWMNR